ncbi:MAG: D-aminoacyl-tRNA deacylase [Thermoproteota archaeon]|nr:D-aminoacyl-tRNA deacylase [Thermoproteota archaeon]
MKDHYVLITSAHDLAGITISNYLKGSAGFECENLGECTGNIYCSPTHTNIELYIYSGDLLTLKNVPQMFSQSDVLIFLSKHKSRSSIPTLTCHFTGNFSGDSSYGGNPRQLAIAYPSLLKAYLKAVTAANQKAAEYEVIIEATHHGPTSIDKPLLFIELGSSEKQWKDENAAAVICNSLLEVLDKGFEHCKKIGIGLGGTHYPKKFNDLLLKSEFALAAVASKYNLESIDDEILYQMISRSKENVTHVIVDSNGLGRQRNRILKLLNTFPLEIYGV